MLDTMKMLFANGKRTGGIDRRMNDRSDALVLLVITIESLPIRQRL